MKKEELDIVHKAIDKHGDSFWNDPSSNPDDNNAMEDLNGNWNGYLFDEVVNMLEKDGYDLELVKKEAQKRL